MKSRRNEPEGQSESTSRYAKVMRLIRELKAHSRRNDAKAKSVIEQIRKLYAKQEAAEAARDAKSRGAP